MNRDLEAAAGDFHGALWIFHAFAARFFFKRRRYGWAAFHLAASVISFIASRIHARDSR